MSDFQNTLDEIRTSANTLLGLVDKIENKPRGWKKASANMRKLTLHLGKLYKKFRVVSVAEQKAEPE